MTHKGCKMYYYPYFGEMIPGLGNDKFFYGMMTYLIHTFDICQNTTKSKLASN